MQTVLHDTLSQNISNIPSHRRRWKDFWEFLTALLFGVISIIETVFCRQVIEQKMKTPQKNSMQPPDMKDSMT